MGMTDPWAPFREVTDDPWKAAREWKNNSGGKVIGHLLPDVPEELLHAAGALPVALEGAGTSVSHAQAHIPGYTCSHAMGALDLGLRGDLGVLDGAIIPYVCDTTRNLFHVWNHCFPQMANEFLRLPKRLDHPGARDYLAAEFRRLRDALARITGTVADDDGLRASISLYNESRGRLRSAYRKRRETPSVWTAPRVQLLFSSALRAPRDQHLRWMERLPWNDAAESERSLGIPVYVRGKVWDPPEMLGLLDDVGLFVVRDEMVTGFRSFACDVAVNNDPIDALVERHLANVPYTGYHLDPAKIVRGFIERVRESGAQGVIFLNPKFCEAAAFDTPDLQTALKEASIPSLVLETSARGTSPGQIRIRVEAFQEMLAGDLP